jgi:putative oxidoreductase
MKEYINSMSRFCSKPSLGLLIISIAVGAVFLSHGWMKIGNVDMVSGMLEHMGVFAPAFFGPFISWLEVVGGLMLIFGVLTRVAGVLLGIEMLVAILLTGIGNGFGPHEMEVLLMAGSFGIALAGSGRYALYPMECKECAGMLCNEDNCKKTT